MKQGLIKVVLLEKIGSKDAGVVVTLAATTAAHLIKSGKAEKVTAETTEAEKPKVKKEKKNLPKTKKKK